MTGTRVGRLRVHAPAADGARAARDALIGARVRPAGLGRSAVLVVRRLADPLPGTLGSGSGAAAWDRAATAALDGLLRGAARPAAGPVPAGAAAVLFADQAELLAALAADWVAGELAARWWWREWRGSGAVGAADAVVRTWAAAPRYAPAALELLGGTALAVAGALPEAAARDLAAGVAAVFGVPEAGQVPRRGDSTPAGPGHHPPPAGPDPPVAPPWERVVPEAAAAGLSPGQRLLLGLGLALRRAPALARQPAFQRAVEAWSARATEAFRSPPATVPTGRDDRGTASVPPTRPDASVVGPTGAGHGADPPAPGPAGALREARQSPGPATGRGAHATGRSAPEATLPAAVVPAAVVPAAVVPAAVVPESGLPDAAVVEAALSDAVPGAAVPDAVPAPLADAVRLDDHAAGRGADGRAETVDTDLGGLFHLLNLAQYLGLYGDFTTPAEPGIALDPWDLVALLGRELLGPPIPEDQIWALLRRLSGGEPGRDPDPPGEWQIPLDWGAPSASGPTPLRRWIAALAVHVRARLAAALDRPPEAAVALLLHRHARVLVTPTHVDVEFSLAELPIEVRLAGLDRDPGWVPAAGRVVTYHFD